MGTVKAQVDRRDANLSSSQGPFTSPPANNAAPIRQNMSPDVFTKQSSLGLRPFNSQRSDRYLDEISPHMRPAELGILGGSALEESPLQATTILMRGLPSNMSQEALISMFLFSEDYIDAQFASRDFAEDGALLSAFARFRTFEGAYEVRQRLHGKQNATNNGTMHVEVLGNGGAESPRLRRKASDAQPNRQLSNSASSGSSNGQSTRQSRYNKTFQFMDKLSPTRGQQSLVEGDLLNPDLTTTSRNKLFSPTTRARHSFQDNRRMSGKAVINDDSADDETGELIKDPLAFVENGRKASMRRASANPQAPISRLAGLSLNTNNGTLPEMNTMLSPTEPSGFSSSRPSLSLQPPIVDMSPNSLVTGMTPMSPSTSFPLSPQQFQPRHQYPPANPADQNPPCNTLYVGNLPVDTSEDELKAMFSKQRGYKRLCFRTKHNGPMCFVEFEDITFATKALNELYGQPLHNSVKGGIRLSFSKNPLGVRSGSSTNAGGPQSPLASPTSTTTFGSVIGAPPGFGSAIAPPPGLLAPPGLSSPIGMGPLNHSNSPVNSNNLFSSGNPPLSSHAQSVPRSAQQGLGAAYVGAPASTNSYNSGPNGFSDFGGGR